MVTRIELNARREDILASIKAENSGTASDLAMIHQTSLATIKRDLQALRERGYNIKWSKVAWSYVIDEKTTTKD